MDVNSNDNIYGDYLNLYNNNPNPPSDMDYFSSQPMPRIPPGPQEVVWRSLPGLEISLGVNNTRETAEGVVWLVRAHPSTFVGQVDIGFSDQDALDYIQLSNPSLFDRLDLKNITKDVKTPSILPNKSINLRQNGISPAKRTAPGDELGGYSHPSSKRIRQTTSDNTGKDENYSNTHHTFKPSKIPVRPRSKVQPEIITLDGTDDPQCLILDTAMRLMPNFTRTSDQTAAFVPDTTQKTGDLSDEYCYAHNSNSSEALALRAARDVNTAETLRLLEYVEKKRNIRKILMGEDYDQPSLRIFTPVDRISSDPLYKMKGLQKHDKYKRKKIDDTHAAGDNGPNSFGGNDLLATSRARLPESWKDILDQEPLPCLCREDNWYDLTLHCAAEFCHIGWYHPSCVGLSSDSIRSSSWYCPACAEHYQPNASSSTNDDGNTSSDESSSINIQKCCSSTTSSPYQAHTRILAHDFYSSSDSRDPTPTPSLSSTISTVIDSNKSSLGVDGPINPSSDVEDQANIRESSLDDEESQYSDNNEEGDDISTRPTTPDHSYYVSALSSGHVFAPSQSRPRWA